MLLDPAIAVPLLSIAILAASWLLLRHYGSSPIRDVSPWLLALDVAPVALGWLALTCLTARPLFASAMIATLALVLWLGDCAKQKAMGEPLVFSDGTQVSVLRHPPLYAEFMTPGGLIVSILAAIVALAGVGSLEQPLWVTIWPSVVALPLTMAGWLALPSGRAFIGFLSRRGIPAASGDPVKDRTLFGPLASVIVHTATVQAERPVLLSHCTLSHTDQLSDVRRRPSCHADRPSGPIVLLELESFFDARRLGPMIPNDLLCQFDRLTAEAVLYGRMGVPAYGANTVRTEFAALTGLPKTVLGLDRFNPYAGFARSRVDSIAWHLRSWGYRTICIHPFDRTFYARHRVMPQLGFDTFIDIRAFQHPGPERRYVSDSAVMDMVSEQLDRHGPDTFVFAITMGNHSPWSKSARPAPVGHADWPAFDGFLKGLMETDAALGHMADLLSRQNRPALLAAFGDHQPAFHALYRRLGYTDRATDYLIWRSDRVGGPNIDIMAHDLPRLVLRHATPFKSPVNAGDLCAMREQLV